LNQPLRIISIFKPKFCSQKRLKRGLKTGCGPVAADLTQIGPPKKREEKKYEPNDERHGIQK
jgi:hypothetical protein